jgi:hypothetical protein
MLIVHVGESTPMSAAAARVCAALLAASQLAHEHGMGKAWIPVASSPTANSTKRSGVVGERMRVPVSNAHMHAKDDKPATTAMLQPNAPPISWGAITMEVANAANAAVERSCPASRLRRRPAPWRVARSLVTMLCSTPPRRHDDKPPSLHDFKNFARLWPRRRFGELRRVSVQRVVTDS